MMNENEIVGFILILMDRFYMLMLFV